MELAVWQHSLDVPDFLKFGLIPEQAALISAIMKIFVLINVIMKKVKKLSG